MQINPGHNKRVPKPKKVIHASNPIDFDLLFKKYANISTAISQSKQISKTVGPLYKAC